MLNRILSVFKKQSLKDPNKLGEVLAKWDVEGKEYGPYSLEYILSKPWSDYPQIGKFEGHRRWRNFKYFLELADCLGPTLDQVAFLEKHDITFDRERTTLREAFNLVQNQESVLAKQAIEVKRIFEAERAIEKKRKDGLPATAHMRKKMSGFGIPFDDSVTRAEATQLVRVHEKRELFSETLSRIKKHGWCIEGQMDDAVFLETDGNECSIADYLEDIVLELDEIEALKVEIAVQLSWDLAKVKNVSERLSNARFESENAEDELRERELLLGGREYRVKGRFPAKEMKGFRKLVFETSFQGNWVFERDLPKAMQEKFTDVRLEEVES
jgi:hypothetical protein